MLSRTHQVIWRTRDPEGPPSARTQSHMARTPQSESTDRYGWPNMENAVKSDNQPRGRRKIQGTKYGREQEQDQEPKSNMSDPEDTPGGTNTIILK